MSEPTPAQPSWWDRKSRRNKFLLTVSVLLLVAIALGLGLGLGLGLKKGSDEEQSTSTSSASPFETLAATPKDLGIWQPSSNTTWQIILSGTIALAPGTTSITPDVDVFDIDLFTTPQATIDTLHSLRKRVVCYFSAGSFEAGRPDANEFKSGELGKVLKGWRDERWLDLRSANVRAILVRRMELAARKGCDGVDPDNTDGYVRSSVHFNRLLMAKDNDNGLGLTAADSLSLLRNLTATAQRLRLAIGLKNSAALVPAVLPAVQFAVNEECVAHGECGLFAGFVGAGKPVFHIEYPGKADAATISRFCEADRFSTVIKRDDLDGWVQYCNGLAVTTPTDA